MDKRIEYISAELKRQEESIKDLDKKQDDLRENLTNMQTQMQKLVQAWRIAEGIAHRVCRAVQFSAKLLGILSNINALLSICTNKWEANICPHSRMCNVGPKYSVKRFRECRAWTPLATLARFMQPFNQIKVVALHVFSTRLSCAGYKLCRN